MKFSTWQLVAILAILMAAIVCAHIFAPGAAPTVIGMATTLFAALFVSHDKGDPPPPNTGASSDGGATLKVIAGGMSVLVLALVALVAMAGCGASFDDLEKAAAQGDNASKLALCRADARTAFYVEGKSVEDAMKRYDACAAKAEAK